MVGSVAANEIALRQNFLPTTSLYAVLFGQHLTSCVDSAQTSTFA